MTRLVLLAVPLLFAACTQGHQAPPITTSPARSASTGVGTLAQAQPSPNIREAQQRLRTLGIYHSQIDGMWGPDTQAAVERFQKNRGLATTAVLDASTLNALRTDAHTAVASGPMRLTDPTDIRTLQNRLAQLTFYDGPADGIWGPRTQVALERFQRTRGLPVGQVTFATVTAMGLDPAAFPTRTASAAPIGHPLEPGAVRTVQAQLRRQGFYSGGADGIWGPRTQRGLEHFQRSRGLEATGDLNPLTASALGLGPNNLASGTR